MKTTLIILLAIVFSVSISMAKPYEIKNSKGKTIQVFHQGEATYNKQEVIMRSEWGVTRQDINPEEIERLWIEKIKNTYNLHCIYVLEKGMFEYFPRIKYPYIYGLLIWGECKPLPEPIVDE